MINIGPDDFHNRTSPHNTTECLDFATVPPAYINYASLPMLALVILISFSVKRKRLWPGCCQGRPGILIPMDLAKGKSSRVALSAAFAILTSRLMRLLLHGDIYWDFPGMEDPEYAEKMSFLRIFINICNSVQLSLCFYPLFVCIIHRQHIFLNVLGYLSLTPWFYFTVDLIRRCSIAPDVTIENLTIFLVVQIPEFIAYAYLIYFFTKCLAINIYRKRRCCKCKYGSFDLTPAGGRREPIYMIYVRGLLRRKKRKLTGVMESMKEALTYRKIPGLLSSPRILITLTVASLAVYSLSWTVFRAVNILEDVLRQNLKALEDELGVNLETVVHKQLIDDYFKAFVYGAYACSFLSLLCEFLCLWRVYVNYRKSVRQLLRGNKNVYNTIDMWPEDLMVYASKYPGFQIAFTVYGYLVTFFVLFIFLVVIFTFLLVLPLKWGFTSLVWKLIKSNWQTVVLSFIIYYAQVVFAKFVFFDRETGMYDNRRLFCVTDYFLFFFNALLSLFTSLQRILVSLVIGVVYLSRLDQCGMVRGFEIFDNGHKAFIAMLHVEVTQNNPIVLSFIDLLSQGALKRRAAAEISPETPLYMVEGGNMTTIEDPKCRRRRWVVNQWHKAYTLINNSSLVVERFSENARENGPIYQPEITPSRTSSIRKNSV